MTVVSNTVFAQQGSSPQDEATVMKGGGPVDSEEPVVDFDLGFSEDDLNTTSGGSDEEATELRGDSSSAEPEFDSEDETLMPGEQQVGGQEHEGDYHSDDETLLPGGLEDSDDDATLRPDVGDDSLDQYLEGLDTGKDKKKD